MTTSDGPCGTELARSYFLELVAPELASIAPRMPYAAGRLGSGSDVLGYDDVMSQDHDWGLRLHVLVPSGEEAEVARQLDHRLPESYRGHPLRFATTWAPHQHLGVEVSTASAFTRSRLGFPVLHDLSLTEWLSVTGQAVLEVTAGPVFVDSSGEITRIRERLSWYPDALWRYVVAADWRRVAEELPFVGRAAQRGDDMGSRVITARVVRSLTHLGFLLDRVWPPYSKWIGTRFAGLDAAATTAETLAAALTESDWRAREAALADAIEIFADHQRSLGLPTPDAVVQPFFDRPYRGVTDVCSHLLESIEDPRVRLLPPGLGSIEQWSDSVALLTDASARIAATSALVSAADSA